MFSMHHLASSVAARNAHPADENASGQTPQRDSTLAELCALLGIAADLHGQPAGLGLARKRVRAGEALYHIDDPFRQLYLLSSGFMKAVAMDPSGSEQVVGFSMRRSLLGVDGIAYGRHMNSAVALTDVGLILMPLHVIRQLTATCPGLSRGLYGAMSRELAHAMPATSRLGLTTRGRLGRLLLDLADRFASLGYSSTTFNLPMARADIASYLGMAQETVSRGLMELESSGLIRLEQRTIHILDREGLRALKRMPRLSATNDK
nr:Crp/Fnr family transcriptional regulator [uncultured Duganella sp.]